jgi:threonine synthase
VAGLRKLRERGDIEADEQVVCLTTGHLLKDPDAAVEAGTEPEPVPDTTAEVLDHLESAER